MLNVEKTPTIAECISTSWAPGIGDPTVWGWLMVGIYAVAALIALLTVRKAHFPKRTRTREQVFWMCLFAGLALLALNKQFDLQTLVTVVGRCMSQAQDWYDDRRVVQALVILGLGMFVILMGAFVLGLLWGTMRRSALPLIGAVFICGFVMMRAVGFHNVDELIGTSVRTERGSLKVNFLLEAPGPLLIMISGLWLSIGGFRERRD